MSYDLLFIDIDGTLLDDNHQIPQGNIEAIQKVSAKGIPVILATGRPPLGAYYIQDKVGVDTPLICCNGSLIVDRKKEPKYVRNVTLSPQEVEIILFNAQYFDVCVTFYDFERWYAEKVDEWIERESNIIGLNVELIDFDQQMDNWYEDKTGPNKALVMGREVAIDAFQEAVKIALFNAPINTYKTKPNYSEITHVRASKMEAIKQIHTELGIDKERVMAIGDNHNDVEMLEYVGCGVAMANAKEEVKQKANEVAPSNEEEGVRQVLEKYFL